MSVADFLQFFSSLFQKQEFFAQFVERSFFTVASIAELLTALFILFAAYKTSVFAVNRYIQQPAHKNFFHYWSGRLIFPALILAYGLTAASLWRILSGNPAVWLRLLAITAPWMMLIRTFTAVLHYILPDNRFSSSAERFFSGLIWCGFVLWFSGLNETLYEWASSINFTLGKTSISLYVLANGIFWVFITIMAAMWIAQFLENRLMKLERINLNLRIVLGKVMKTLMIILAVLITLSAAGIDLTVLSVFGGALGIGLGFGLQKIASNYVSGFIILLERSVRPGDRLTVGGFTGKVTKIQSRYSVLQNASGEEALVPNETFISSPIISSTYDDNIIWRKLEVQVAYNTDLPFAMNLMVEAATASSRVDKNKPPKGLVVNFADSGITLGVSFWVQNPELGFSSLDSEILFGIWQRFNEHKIEFPYPQREVRILRS